MRQTYAWGAEASPGFWTFFSVLFGFLLTYLYLCSEYD